MLAARGRLTLAFLNDGLRKIDFVLVYEGESPKDTMDFQETLVDNAGGDPER